MVVYVSYNNTLSSISDNKKNDVKNVLFTTIAIFIYKC